MKIGLVLEEFDPSRGGLAQWSVQFAARLLERGHEVHVVARRFGKFEKDLAVKMHHVADVRSQWHFARNAEKCLRSLDLDIIHDMGAGWYCDILQPHSGSRKAVVQQNLKLTPRWIRLAKRIWTRILPRYRQLEKMANRQCADHDRIIMALSKRVANDFERLHGVSPKQIRLVYNGVDVERFSPKHREKYRSSTRQLLNVGDDTMLLLIVAHNFRLKGVPTLLKAVAKWKNQDRPIHLAVVGGKRLKPYLRMARRLGIADHVTFVGVVKDAVPFYAAADVYVHPTLFDPCSLVVLEAMASALPVVTSRFNGVSELLTKGHQGHVISDPLDANELLECLRLFTDTNICSQMGLAARKLALNHSFEHNVDEVLSVYQELARNKSQHVIEFLKSEHRPNADYKNRSDDESNRSRNAG